MVCKLRQSLYGLNQAPQRWFAKLSRALETYGFIQSLCDYSLFIFQRLGIQIVALVYVDDLIMVGNNHAAIKRFKDYLHACFHMKDLGLLGAKPALTPLEQNHKLALADGQDFPTPD
ncbi:hypothetical protein L6164_005643 [Bauhinia variegata]|uniref:Uncharacterized protein n=1 Tax=Bauhinia variegata TaxID=167791 RepID=A0ACB9PR94_BAUVA|nr:hypothetical protein L6164_005643 [Bauhinia variegata]